MPRLLPRFPVRKLRVGQTIRPRPRWADLPWRIRWTIGGIAVVVLALAIVWALLVPLADWLARHDVGSVKGALHETAVDNARGRLLTLGAGLFAVGALVFTARNFTLSREGQVTDRYTKAIEQLGSDKLDVRIGGIYALERVARDSARDHPTVMEVLTAFIRDHSREQWPPLDSGGREPERSTRPDVQAAVTVVGRQDAKHGIRRIDLTGADLGGANLASANLPAVQLGGANLAHANLEYANLARAVLIRADLTGADLGGANLAHANLLDADLGGANFASANLSGAAWPEDVPVPEGWERDTNLGGLMLKWPGPARAFRRWRGPGQWRS